MAKKKYEVIVPGNESKVLLHTCCAPCSSAIIECMLKHNITPIIYYSNPNIYPEEEYMIRKNECTRYAQSLGLQIIDDDYDHDTWLQNIKGLECQPERGSRCLECFKLRLRRTARYAHENGIRVITTTLASSRWKSLGQICSEAIRRCLLVGPELAQGRLERTQNSYHQGIQLLQPAVLRMRIQHETRHCD